MPEHYDTVLSVPGRDGAASMLVQLNLYVSEPDLSDLEALLEPEKLAVSVEALDVAEAPKPAIDHVRQALGHLVAGVVRAAWPPLVIGIEVFSGQKHLKRGTWTTTTDSPTKPRVA